MCLKVIGIMKRLSDLPQNTGGLFLQTKLFSGDASGSYSIAHLKRVLNDLLPKKLSVNSSQYLCLYNNSYIPNPKLWPSVRELHVDSNATYLIYHPTFL